MEDLQGTQTDGGSASFYPVSKTDNSQVSQFSSLLVTETTTDHTSLDYSDVDYLFVDTLLLFGIFTVLLIDFLRRMFSNFYGR